MHPFINRLLCFMLAIALVVALAVPVFAASYGGYELPDVETVWDKDTYPYYLITYAEPNHYLRFSKNPLYFDGSTAHLVGASHTYTFTIGSSTNRWVSNNIRDEGFTAENYFDRNIPVWSNYDIINIEDNSIVFTPPVIMCDGSSCPATDADHNNICDDCGNVLAYNLRSTLLDFAKSTAESFGSGYPYYAVLEHPSKDSSYNLYISKSPMRADAPNYEVAIGESMQYTEVFTNDDGSFDRATWASVASFSGTLVYSNHTIENFQTPPLAAVIQGVTGEALEVEIPNLMAETKIIVLCGVGCLALLILLVLLSTKLKRYLKG